MLRLTFLSDIGHLAPDDDEVAALRTIPEFAASEVDDININALMDWMVKKGWHAAVTAFPRDRYEELSEDLHKDS
jgi:hypothetical protein